ncbi:S41 family peptidase [Aquimarina sp. D1M17]|uniref:S41 family peptidase n=1 Tax=Aquimarina acroporae TaxID=2937283 RepID=UPI0020BE40E5|nr:S41 family peptidase [Aquimarina acroporae]MCK8523370.1 S41 family peptidase [Aquimarina acroporae]
MQKIHFLVLFWITIHSISAQKSIDSTALRKDLDIFERILKKGHPGLYEYITQDSLDIIFETTKDSIKEGLTDLDGYKKMVAIADQIKDGNLKLLAPQTLKTDRYYFPLILKIINAKFYTDTEDHDIPIGSEIKKINHKKTSKIIHDLKKYTPSDGNNLTKKYRDLELKFGLFYAYEYGVTKTFEISYITPEGDEKTTTIEAESFVKVKLRNLKRNSYFASYHQKKNGFDYFDKYIGNLQPFVYYKNESNTAILVINSFRNDVQLFQSNLTKIFKEINAKKVKNLIIDIRQNDGGYRANAVHLFSFITSKTFKQYQNEYVVSLSIPEKKYVVKSFLNEKEFLENKFRYHPVYDGWKLNFDDMESLMVPDENRFKGKVYVLGSGINTSAAANFALNVKNDPNIVLLGEEIAGGYYFHIGEFPAYYELPNTGIQLILYMEKITHYVKDLSITRGSGIPPDKYISITRSDLIQGRDPVLDYIFKLVGGGNK